MIDLFVYGTLMRGMPNNWRLKGGRFVRTATTRPEWAMYARLNGWCPEVIEGEDAIRGELYEVPAYVLARLDRNEGHPTVYFRSVERLSDGRDVEMYVFQWAPEGPYIPSGSWREHVGDVRRHYGDRLLSTTEAADLLGLNVSRVRAMCAAGRLGQKIGHRWAISDRELEAFCRRRRRPGRRPRWDGLRLFTA